MTVNGKRISRTDIVATNGVVHFITDVIDTPAIDDCTKVLTDDGRFSTLLTAVSTAGLVETLQGEGPFTIFAPTDEAFSRIPADTLDTVLADNDLLTSNLLRLNKFMRFRVSLSARPVVNNIGRGENPNWVQLRNVFLIKLS